MPSSRALAADVGLSRSTVVAAYEQLVAEGYLRAHHGRSTVVADVHAVAIPDDSDVMGPTPTYDFRPGEPDASAFPRTEWQRSVKRILSSAPDDAFGYPDPRGVPELRATLAEYLARSRTVHADAAAVRVYGGFASALGFIAEALRRRGVTRIGVERPTLPFHVEILRLAGLRTVPVPVDRHGIRVDLLDRMDVGAVVVTPANQYPLGVTLGAQRRTEIVQWARRRGGWIVEDDYDGEFRYDRRPIGALQGLAADRVIYAGTASKSIGPAIRIGWLVVPEPLRHDLFVATHVRAGVSAIDQLALHDFIERGGLDRHLRSMRQRYHARSDRLRALLAAEVSWLELSNPHAGLHLTATSDRLDEGRALAAAERASVGLFGLATHHGARTERGLVIGFSRPSEHAFANGLDRLVDVLRRL